MPSRPGWPTSRCSPGRQFGFSRTRSSPRCRRPEATRRSRRCTGAITNRSTATASRSCGRRLTRATPCRAPCSLRSRLFGRARSRARSSRGSSGSPTTSRSRSIRGRAREAPTDAPAPAAVSDDPETREQLRTLVSDLSALPDRQRGAIVMRELSGLSYMEIGAALGTSQAAGKQLVYEARLALQDLRAGHEMSCELVRERISARDRRVLRGRKIRSHLRGCQPCQDFERAIRPRRNAFALLAPPLSPLVAATVFQEVLGAGAATGGTGGAAGAVGATGMASGGIPAAAGPVLLKVAAAVLVAGAAGVGAYEAGRSILAGDSGSMPAAAASAAQAGRHDGPADTGHAARPTSAREGAGDARARGADQDKGPIGASDSAAGDEGATPQVDDQASPGTHGAPDSAATGGSDPTNPGGSDAIGTAAPGPTEQLPRVRPRQLPRVPPR